jgi:ribokinase
MSVLVFGSLNLDLVAYAKQLPTLGQTVTGEKLLRFPGGKGLNQAIAAQRSGAQVIMVGALGRDSEGDFLGKVLVEEKIDPSFISSVEEQTGIAVIEVSSEAQNRILTIPGANATVNFDDRYLSNPDHSKVCLAQLETPISEVSKFIIKAKSTGRITILNPAPIQDLASDLINACDYLIVNESEASYLTGKSVEKLDLNLARDIGKKLISKGAKTVVITLAENGSLYLDKADEIYTPAFKISAIDTTAAGDAFCGAFATAISNQKPISYCLKFASAAGALAATKAGAVPSLPYSKEILSLIASVQ